MPDPERRAELEGEKLRQFMEAVIEDEGASLALRKHVAARYPVAAGRSAPRTAVSDVVVPEVLAGLRRAARRPQPAVPPRPRLRRGPEPLGAARHRRRSTR